MSVSSGAHGDLAREPAAQRALAGVRATVVATLILSIRIYQWLISPLLGNCCRFEPSCSRYAQICIERLGPVRGSWRGLLRVLRCHPFCPGGHDPPPEVTS
ncbi:MAG TPA: membrane protein insertion efficiency factor YidD [Polyangiaceae bacterium]|nr:membrane protein insertion efficiency factor YidD [Polyangiaceae bacterium]